MSTSRTAPRAHGITSVVSTARTPSSWQIATRSAFTPVESAAVSSVRFRSVHAQHELRAGGDGGTDLASVERVDADAHPGRDEAADDVGERREREPRRAADVDDVRARLPEVLGSGANLVVRQPRRVV